MAEYVELHCHSAFSFREGASTPLELALTASHLGYRALALTDHDSLAGAMEFAQTAPDWGLKPIIGAEITFRTDPPAHLTLLAKTPRGYANLSRLLSEALLTSPRDEPSLVPAALQGRTAGLIALSGCSQGEVPKRVMQYDTSGARAAAEHYIDLFGRDNFYVELQNNLVYGDTRRNRGLVELARQLSLNIVATNNVHYHERDRHRLQDVLVAVRHKTTLDASERLRRKNSEFYLKSAEQMAALFPEHPETLSNTLAIAERCTFDMKKDLTYVFPDYEAPEGKNVDDYLEEVCRAAALELYPELTFATTSRRRGNSSSPTL
jgi:error-prone DNA polymerase